MVSIGNDPQMAELFRLVKYYNLPRLLWILQNDNTVISQLMGINIFVYHVAPQAIPQLSLDISGTYFGGTAPYEVI